MTACNHEWESIHIWTARYRCKLCGALGYRKLVLPRGMNSKPGRMVEYRCQQPGCQNPAQVSNKSGRRRCFQHWKGSK